MMYPSLLTITPVPAPCELYPHIERADVVVTIETTLDDTFAATLVIASSSRVTTVVPSEFTICPAPASDLL